MIDDMGEAAVSVTLNTAWLGRVYRYMARTGSTNEDMKRWASAEPPAAHGAVLMTDFQTAGRGRLDRRWDAPAGTSLLLSVLLRPDGWSLERGAWLTMLAGLAVAEAIEDVTGVAARLKWPNDVVLGQTVAWRKVCGLLLDTTLDVAGRLDKAIVGIGLNVNIPAAQLPVASTPATSLLLATGGPVDRRVLLAALLARLERRYEATDAGQSPVADWAARLVTLGQRVMVSATGSGALVGLAEGTDEWGRLLLRDDSGQVHTIAAGDVTLRG